MLKTFRVQWNPDTTLPQWNRLKFRGWFLLELCFNFCRCKCRVLLELTDGKFEFSVGAVVNVGHDNESVLVSASRRNRRHQPRSSRRGIIWNRAGWIYYGASTATQIVGRESAVEQRPVGGGLRPQTGKYPYRCFAKFSPTVPSPLAMILIGRGHRFGDSLDDLERVAKGCMNLSKFIIVLLTSSTWSPSLCMIYHFVKMPSTSKIKRYTTHV